MPEEPHMLSAEYHEPSRKVRFVRGDPKTSATFSHLEPDEARRLSRELAGAADRAEGKPVGDRHAKPIVVAR